jgi:hypothetical protein
MKLQILKNILLVNKVFTVASHYYDWRSGKHLKPNIRYKIITPPKREPWGAVLFTVASISKNGRLNKKRIITKPDERIIIYEN